MKEVTSNRLVIMNYLMILISKRYFKRNFKFYVGLVRAKFTFAYVVCVRVYEVKVHNCEDR